MYNGIGLQTPRGSGTSGYVQKNLSYVKPVAGKNRDNFLKDLQALKDNVLPPPKKANSEIIYHQQKRDIQLELAKLRAELENRGIPEKDIDERVKKAEEILNDKLKNGELRTQSSMDSHKKALEKEKEYERIRKAFNVDESYVPGSAFDFDGQEKQRLLQMFEKGQQQIKMLEEKREKEKMRKKEEKEKLKAGKNVKALESEKATETNFQKQKIKDEKVQEKQPHKKSRENSRERQKEKSTHRRHDYKSKSRSRSKSHSKSNEKDEKDFKLKKRLLKKQKEHEKYKESSKISHSSKDRKKKRTDSSSKSSSSSESESRSSESNSQSSHSS